MTGLRRWETPTGTPIAAEAQIAQILNEGPVSKIPPEFFLYVHQELSAAMTGKMPKEIDEPEYPATAV